MSIICQTDFKPKRSTHSSYVASNKNANLAHRAFVNGGLAQTIAQ